MKKKLQIALRDLKSRTSKEAYWSAVVNSVERYANGEGELEDLILGRSSTKVDFGEYITVNTKWGDIDFFNAENYPQFVDRVCAFWSLNKTSEKPSVKINIIFPVGYESNEFIPIDINVEYTSSGISFEVPPNILSQMLASKYYER